MTYFVTTEHDCKHKAYNRGCMAGMAGLPASRCPYPDDEQGTYAVCHKWWLVGWQDGHSAYNERRLSLKRNTTPPVTTPPETTALS